jgi:hypothetical protein
LILTAAANADFKDIVAGRFASKPENLIVNLPPRPGTWPGAIFTFNTRFPAQRGERNDPALHGGDKLTIQANDDFHQDASPKNSLWSFLGLPPQTAEGAEVVISFSDAQVVDMSPPDLLRHVETAPAAATAAKRGQIPLIVSRAYVGTPVITVSRKADTPPEMWAKLKESLQPGAQGSSSIQDNVSYVARDPLVFAFEVAQISFDPGELSKGNIKASLAPLPSSLFAVREQESDRALAAAESAISAITGLSAHEVQQKWIFLDSARPSAPLAQTPAPARSTAEDRTVNPTPAAIPTPVARPGGGANALLGERSSARVHTHHSSMMKPKPIRKKSKQHRRAGR